MTYYLFASWEGGAWAPQFGDKERECVDFEAAGWRASLPRGERSGSTVVLSFPRVPTQKQITARLAALSEKTAAQRASKAAGDTRHNVYRSCGNRIEVRPAVSLRSAAAEFINETLALIEANGARDTVGAWTYYGRAQRIGRDIVAGLIIEAELRAYGERITFTVAAH